MSLSISHRRKFLVIAPIILLFLSSIVISNPSAYANEILPWGVERVRAHCVWDKDMTMIIDPGANAGQGVTVAIIDSGVDDHPDLHDNLIGGRGFEYYYGTIREHDDYSDLARFYNGHGTKVQV